MSSSDILDNFLVGYNNLSDIQNKRLLASNKNGFKVISIILTIVMIVCTVLIILYIQKENNSFKNEIKNEITKMKHDITQNIQDTIRFETTLLK